jgi:putative phage-type endonuclease
MTLTPEQLEKRRLGIGGSDVAAICGLNPYKTAVDVYLEKVLQDNPFQETDNDHLWFGKEIEPFVIKRFLFLYPQQISYPDTAYDKEYPFLLGNVDGILEDKSVLEAKNVGHFSKIKWGESGSDKIPIEYYLQVAHYVRILDAPRGIIVAYFGGADFRIYEYKRNKIIEEKIKEKCISFWQNHVLTQTPPGVESYEDARKLWREIIPESQIESTEEIQLYINQYHDKNKLIKEIEKEIDQIKTIICKHMQDNELLMGPDGKIMATWKKQSSLRFDTNLFKAKEKTLYEQYLRETSTERVLKIK